MLDSVFGHLPWDISVAEWLVWDYTDDTKRKKSLKNQYVRTWHDRKEGQLVCRKQFIHCLPSIYWKLKKFMANILKVSFYTDLMQGVILYEAA